jgi:hypothetical protein
MGRVGESILLIRRIMHHAGRSVVVVAAVIDVTEAGIGRTIGERSNALYWCLSQGCVR